MSVNATFAVSAHTRNVSRRPCTCPTTGNILILHKPLTATVIIFIHRSLLLAFSLDFPSSSAFPISLFRQSSHLTYGHPHFLQPPCFFVSDLFGNLSSLILHYMSGQFHLALYFLFFSYTRLSFNLFCYIFHSPNHSVYTSHSAKWLENSAKQQLLHKTFIW